MTRKYIEAICVDWLNAGQGSMSPDGHSFHLTTKSATAIAAYIEAMKWGRPDYGRCPPEVAAQTTEARLVHLPAHGPIAQELRIFSAARVTAAHLYTDAKMKRELMRLQFSRARIAISYRKPKNPKDSVKREQLFKTQLAQARTDLKRHADPA